MASEVFTHTTRDGRTLSWSGLEVCVCSKCDEIFSSPTAFDAHLIRKGPGGRARHDPKRLPLNAKGWRVTKLYTRPESHA